MLKQEQIRTPELDKMLAVQDKSQPISEFLCWLNEQDIVLVQEPGDDCDCCGNVMPMKILQQNTEQLLAKFFEIDLAKCEAERVALLAAVREDNK